MHERAWWPRHLQHLQQYNTEYKTAKSQSVDSNRSIDSKWSCEENLIGCDILRLTVYFKVWWTGGRFKLVYVLDTTQSFFSFNIQVIHDFVNEYDEYGLRSRMEDLQWIHEYRGFFYNFFFLLYLIHEDLV